MQIAFLLTCLVQSKEVFCEGWEVLRESWEVFHQG